MKNHLTQVLIFVLFLTNSCLLSVSHAQSLQFPPETPGETFRNLISAQSHLLLGSSNAIYRLDNSLVRQERKSLEAANRLLVTDYVGSFRDSVLSCSSDSCFLAQITDFTNITWEVDPPFISEQATDNVAAVLAPRANGTSDLTYGERADGRNGRQLAKGSLVNVGAPSSSQLFNRYARRIEGNRFDPLVYLAEFPLRYVNDSGYVYFVVRPTEAETRLVRLCEDDAGVLGAFTSHFEIILKCGSHSDRAPSTAATFINVTTTAFNNRPTIIISTNRVLNTNNVQLEVCSFDVGYINSLMTQKYGDCINARDNAMAGFLRDGQTTCTQVEQPSRVSECFLPGTARPGLEVQDPFVQEPIATLPLGTAATTSIVHTTLDGALYLFAATTNGSLHQFHIPNTTTANYVRTVQLPLDVASLENVTKMVASDNGDYIFAMTPSRLFRHSVDMCDTFTSCSECLTSGDPVCGWCPLRGTCTRQTNCPSVAPVTSPIWISQVSSCPAIDAISPEIVYIPDLSSSTPSFSLTTSNIDGTPLSMYDYNCQFRFQDANGMVMIRDRTATAQSNVFTCTAPPRDQLPQLADGQDTLETVISLTVRNNGDVSIASLDMFPFTDCAVHVSCTSCIGASRCEWCPFSFQCIQPGTSCTTNELTVANGGVCPQIFPSSATGEYLVHSNYDYQETPLRINSSDLTKFRSDFDGGRFTCQICSQNDTSCSEPLFTSPASLAQSGNEILCQRTRFNSDDPTPAITAGIRVVWDNQRTVDNPENASVILYSCSLMGTNCGQCLAQESRFECSYCVEGPAPPVTPGNCQFEATCSTGNGFLRFNDPQDVTNCPRPVITGFEPTAGPTSGGTTVTINGTDLGARREDIVNVMIDGVNCNVTGYTPGISLTCITGAKQGSIVSDKVFITFAHRQGERIQSEDDFEFVTPFLDRPPAIPAMGPRSGGTNITVVGGSIGTGSSHRVTIGQGNCTIIDVSLNEIRCTTPPVGDSGEMSVVTVFVDNWMFGLSGFQYVDDPEFESITPNLTFIAGGTTYTITGRNFDSVQEPRLLVYYDGAPVTVGNRRRRRQIMQEGARFVSEPCSVQSPLTMQCTAPSLSIDGSEFNQSSRSLRIGLLMDGVSSLLVVNETLELHLNPMFAQFGEERVYTIGVPIPLEIQGEGFYFTPGQVIVLVEPCNSDQCLCTVTNVFKSNDTLTCEIDILTQQDLDRSGPLTITVAVGNHRQSVGMIRIVDDRQLELIYYLVPVFAVVIIFVAVVLMVIVAVFCRKARQKDRKYDQLILELEKLESSVARECKQGFAELQTDLDELTGDVVGCRLPYRDLQSYLLTTLFPGAKTHPILQPIEIPNHQRPHVERGLRDFGNLLLDKRTLLIFIRSMEEQRGFTIRDKSIVGSLLIVALHNKLDYATDVLRSLLSELIRKTVQTSYPKLLLRRTESVAEKMLTNWLAFCLHGYVMEHVGQPMYLLYRAVKNQLEKGPIDVITGEARYSLSEQKLIRQKVDMVVLNATVEMDDGLRIPVKLLDCDTISQAKEKMLDAVYKATPVSQRPSLTKVDLEYVKSGSERAILRDEDSSTVVEGGWKKLNTLKHYWVKEGATFRLVQRRDYAPPGRAYDYPGSLISSHTSTRQRALSEAEDGSRVWHLFKQLDMEDPKRSPFMNKKLVSEIYLPRMLSTKSILQKFADDLFLGLFSTSHPPSSPTATYNAVFPNSPGVQVPMGYAPGADAVPMAVKYLFDFLDDEAEAIKISDPDVVHTWKNNALSLRFWVNLIKNPEFVFDINKSHTVDACLSVIAQAFIDGCSSSEMKLTIDSPTSKLLYNKEVQGYKAQVKNYYDNVRNLPRIPEDAMQYYLRQLSTYQSQQMRKTGGPGFVVESALQDLLRYAHKYQEPFLQNLRASGLESKAQLFEGVLKVFSN